jgi:DNA-binding response OmpR family regulator
MSQGTTVLLVEDDRDFRDILQGVLEDEGCVVFTSESGEHALRALGVFHPDLIIVDLVTPMMSGWDLCAALEANPSVADIPVAILSDPEHSRPPRRAHVLEKPVGLRTLTALLEIVNAHQRVS